MCLYLDKLEEAPIIATENIKCYKLVRKVVRAALKDGDKVKIKNDYTEGEYVDAIVRIENDIFFCSNDERLKGTECNYKKRCKYSWVYDNSNIRILNAKGKVVKEKDMFQTIYQDFLVNIGKTYKSALNKIANTVEEGLHTYASIPESYFDKEVSYKYVLIECIIPKGSTYYKGYFGETDSYASDTLKYIKIFKPKKDQYV